MTKSSLLFKAATVSVYRQAERGGDTCAAEPVVLKTGNQMLLLDAEAAELLVGYLRVIRAYFTLLPNSAVLISQLTKQVTGYLSDCLQQSGQAVITNADVSNLISHLGCVDDWQRQYPQPR